MTTPRQTLAAAVRAIPVQQRRTIADVQKNFAALAAEADGDLAALPRDRRVTKPIGRPRTGQKPVISLRIPEDLLAWYRSLGRGYQRKMIEALERGRR